jgi:hypothetical protein
MFRKSQDDESNFSPDEAFARRVRHERNLTWASRAFMGVGLLVVLQHLVAHSGFRPLPTGMGVQDLLVGYPTGMVLFIAGLMIWGRKPTPS